MSDGMRDSRILGDLQEEIFGKAYDLKVAIKKAKDGHRGWRIPEEAILAEINGCLGEVGLVVRRR